MWGVCLNSKIKTDLFPIAVVVMLLGSGIIGALIYYKSNLFADTIYVDDGADLLEMEGSRNTFVLTQDIQLTGTWTPINKFRGVLDGNGFAIKDLCVYNNIIDGGLFGRLKGTVKNLTLYVSLQGFKCAAVAESGGRISNVTVYGYIDSYEAAGIVLEDFKYVSNCTNHANIHGDGDAGGICCELGGLPRGKVSGCTNYGEVRGDGDAGGICCSLGWISKGKISGCTNYGDVYGRYDVDGIVAEGSDSSVHNCHNYGKVTCTKPYYYW